MRKCWTEVLCSFCVSIHALGLIYRITWILFEHHFYFNHFSNCLQRRLLSSMKNCYDFIINITMTMFTLCFAQEMNRNVCHNIKSSAWILLCCCRWLCEHLVLSGIILTLKSIGKVSIFGRSQHADFFYLKRNQGYSKAKHWFHQRYRHRRSRFLFKCLKQKLNSFHCTRNEANIWPWTYIF